MKNIDLLKRAWGDYKSSKLHIENYEQDEVFVDIAAYHLQQGVEKALKFKMMSHGVVFLRVHEIDELCNQMDGENLSYPDWIYNNMDIITKYATKTRYGETIVGNLKKIKELLPLLFQYLLELENQEQKRQLDTSKISEVQYKQAIYSDKIKEIDKGTKEALYLQRLKLEENKE